MRLYEMFRFKEQTYERFALCDAHYEALRKKPPQYTKTTTLINIPLPDGAQCQPCLDFEKQKERDPEPNPGRDPSRFAEKKTHVREVPSDMPDELQRIMDKKNTNKKLEEEGEVQLSAEEFAEMQNDG